MCFCASVSKLQVEGRLSEEYVTILQLVILGTSNILKTAREVMDGIHFFSVPELAVLWMKHRVSGWLFGCCEFWGTGFLVGFILILI